MDTTREAYARLIGILYTDGCVSPKGNGWRIIVSNNSSAIVDSFEETLQTCFEKPVRRSVRGKLHLAVVDSQEVGQLLIDRHATFRTEGCRVNQGCPWLRGGRKPCSSCEPVVFDNIHYPPASLPVFASEAELSAFLQAAFSCDGGINLYVARRGRARWLIRNVYLACKHPTLIHQYADLLVRLEIAGRVSLRDWRVLIQGRSHLVRFANRIGFLPGSIIGANSPYWCGQTKAEILKVLLDSYGNPRSVYDLPMFSSEKLG
jgi:LAGLIDADG-like domain